MEEVLQKISELCRDPMLAVALGKLCLLNAAARHLFPRVSLGDRAERLLPRHLLTETADAFVSSAELDGRSYTVSAQRSGDVLLFTFFAIQEEPSGGLLSDSLMSGMLSALYNIELSAERLRAYLVPEATRGEQYLATLFHSYHLLNHKLSNLNILRQLNEGGMLIVPRRTDLVPLCRDVTDSVNHLTGPELPRIEFSSSTDSLHAIMDAPKAERLIINLLSNALKHTGADGYVRLRLSKNGDNAVISVDDNGSGIAPERLSRVFCAYEARMDARSLSDPGTGGLGLGICRAIAEKHGGALILESREGEGTSVRALLPLTCPGEERLYSDALPAYENSGMSFLLTELTDLLDWQSYRPRHLD